MISYVSARGMKKNAFKLGFKWRTVQFKQRQPLSREPSKKKIGFVGIGNMGSRMTKNLIKKGHEVVIYDKNPEALKAMKDEKVIIADNPVQLATCVDTIITMLPSGAHVIDFYTGPDNVIKSLKPGTLAIDSSSIDPAESCTLGKCLKSSNIHFIDAPVAGGIIGAEKGTLTFMVGGSKEVIDMAEPILMSMGTKLFRCGALGSGQVIKLTNNMLLAISMAGVSEAVHIAVRMGLDPNLVINVINASSGRCWSSEVYSPIPGTMKNVPSDNEYKPGFTCKLMLKDITIVQKMAKECSTYSPLGEKIVDVYSDIVKSPMGNLDFSVVYKFLQSKCK